MCDKNSVSLLMTWTCPVEQLLCKSWLSKSKIDCPRQSGNLIVAPCILSILRAITGWSTLNNNFCNSWMALMYIISLQCIACYFNSLSHCIHRWDSLLDIHCIHTLCCPTMTKGLNWHYWFLERMAKKTVKNSAPVCFRPKKKEIVVFSSRRISEYLGRSVGK